MLSFNTSLVFVVKPGSQWCIISWNSVEFSLLYPFLLVLLCFGVFFVWFFFSCKGGPHSHGNCEGSSEIEHGIWETNVHHICCLIAKLCITILSSSTYTNVGFALAVLTGDSGNLGFLPGDCIWRWKIQVYTYESWQKNLFCSDSGYTLASLLPPIMHYWKWMIEIGVSVNHNSLDEKCEK